MILTADAIPVCIFVIIDFLDVTCPASLSQGTWYVWVVTSVPWGIFLDVNCPRFVSLVMSYMWIVRHLYIRNLLHVKFHICGHVPCQLLYILVCVARGDLNWPLWPSKLACCWPAACMAKTAARWTMTRWVSWCFEPSRPLGVTSGLMRTSRR